jgi:predicted nuclease of restriction endonuclease-like (RecB) superfamily
MSKKEEQDNRKQLGKVKEQVVFPVADALVAMPDNYLGFIQDIKVRIAKSRIEAVLAANSKMILLYWEIGKAILQRQTSEGWGTKVIDRMSYDLKTEFPSLQGFSPRNLKYMRKFAEAWPSLEIVQRSVALIPWRCNITLLDKLNDPELRLWYAQQTIAQGFGKDMLVFQIESELHKRMGASVQNFEASLPPLVSDMAQQSFKDPYIFDFIGATAPRLEHELEQKLMDHIQKFLLELGQGFAFVGRQVHLELAGEDYYLDLLFYHLKLRCYVVIELKAGKFDAGYISKLNMYLNVVNDVLKTPEDKPTIGLLLVKNKNKLTVEYALQGFTNPIGVANWENQIKTSILENIQSSLPTIEEIESELKDEL